MQLSGPDFDTGDPKDTTLVLAPEAEGTGAERLDAFGLLLLEEDGVIKMEEPLFGSAFADTMQGYDFYGDDPVIIKEVKAPANQMPKELVFIPALVLLGLVALLQRSRMSKEGVPA